MQKTICLTGYPNPHFQLILISSSIGIAINTWICLSTPPTYNIYYYVFIYIYVCYILYILYDIYIYIYYYYIVLYYIISCHIILYFMLLYYITLHIYILVHIYIYICIYYIIYIPYMHSLNGGWPVGREAHNPGPWAAQRPKQSTLVSGALKAMALENGGDPLWKTQYGMRYRNIQYWDILGYIFRYLIMITWL